MLEKFLKEHKVEELAMPPYNVKITHDGPYTILKYDQIKSNLSNSIVKECRGIIIRDGEVVCRPFKKFFNYGEAEADQIDWRSARVTEKIDGSLMKVWFDEEWHLSTNNTIDAYKAAIADERALQRGIHSFGELFEVGLEEVNLTWDEFVDMLDPEYTYLFELVSPYTRVVIPYETTSLYLLSKINVVTGHEIWSPADDSYRFRRPRVYDFTPTLENVVEMAKNLTEDDEGYVVFDIYKHRIKVKSPAYVLAHYMRHNNCITKRYMMEVILANEVSEFLTYCPDFSEGIWNLQHQMMFIKEGCKSLKKTAQWWANQPNISRKYFAGYVQDNFKGWVVPAYFYYYTHTEGEVYDSWGVDRWLKVLEEQ